MLTSVRGFVRPEEAAESHGVKANRYVALRNDATFFLRIELNTSASDDELVKRLKGLRKSYNDLTLVPPHVVSSSAYEKARKSIEGGEASYDNDPLWKELDH